MFRITTYEVSGQLMEAPLVGISLARITIYKERITIREPATVKPTPPPSGPVTVVCVSDTHGTRPTLPDGDVLLHAGDLCNTRERGSWSSVQAQLNWLHKQPHRYKVVIAGNHDLILDSAFVSQQWGVGAFQYPAGRDVWAHRMPHDTDILLTHGPPKGHLDRDGMGSRFLLSEIWRVKPRLVVFGHIHGGYGQEEITFDAVQAAYDRILPAGKGLFAIVRMLCSSLIQRASAIMPFLRRRDHFKRATFVNAAVVAGPRNKLTKPAIKVVI
ncbi:hypothetical protein H2199_003997 [Coniosporium tulheliwenetii]|uniref:Uncharacterized protein n=1 Tax=Coniosporium tulheliwenetii TaxID=3383036 RepID=A0ACC2Z979_9PEZI|nr:hypothetical protein H2199_003997 [Cladosporium sp. JES 115]